MGTNSPFSSILVHKPFQIDFLMNFSHNKCSISLLLQVGFFGIVGTGKMNGLLMELHSDHSRLISWNLLLHSLKPFQRHDPWKFKESRMQEGFDAADTVPLIRHCFKSFLCFSLKRKPNHHGPGQRCKISH